MTSEAGGRSTLADNVCPRPASHVRGCGRQPTLRRPAIATGTTAERPVEVGCVAGEDRDAANLLSVLMVTPRFAPEVGGVEQHVLEVARRMTALGCRVTVLTTDRSRHLPETEEIEGVEIRRVSAWPRHRDYHFAPAIYWRILTGRDDWDLVHVQSYHTFVAPLAMLAARRAHLPYVLTFHGGGHSSRLRQSLRRTQWRLLAPLVGRATRLIAVAGFEIDLYGKVYNVPRERFALIPNGVDVTAAEPVDCDGTLIASIGRLERYKGHQRILAAMPAILARRPDARLWIAGSGPYEEELRRRAVALGVAEHVEIRAIPADERERMAREVAHAAVVVLLSEYETHPLAVIEAIALGVPAVVANTSGLAELADRGLAEAVALDSTPEEVAAAVERQLDAKRVPPSQPLPTWDDCASSLLGLYSEVVRQRAAARRTRAAPAHPMQR